jgi:hypothetical protein
LLADVLLGFLAELLLAECDDHDRRRGARRVKAAVPGTPAADGKVNVRSSCAKHAA